MNIPADYLLIPSQDDDYMNRYFAVIDKDESLTMIFFPRRNEKGFDYFFADVWLFFHQISVHGI